MVNFNPDRTVSTLQAVIANEEIHNNDDPAATYYYYSSAINSTLIYGRF